MVVGAKVCELTDGFLWFVCGLYVGILTSPPKQCLGQFLLIYDLLVRSSLGKLAKNWSGGNTYASFGSGEIPKMGGGKSHTCYLHL